MGYVRQVTSFYEYIDLCIDRFRQDWACEVCFHHCLKLLGGFYNGFVALNLENVVLTQIHIVLILLHFACLFVIEFFPISLENKITYLIYFLELTPEELVFTSGINVSKRSVKAMKIGRFS